MNDNPSGSIDGGRLKVKGDPRKTLSDNGSDEVNTGG
jgi:hypothetical protein